MSYSANDAGPAQPRKAGERQSPDLNAALTVHRGRHTQVHPANTTPDAHEACENGRTSTESERDAWRTRALIAEAKVRRLQEHLRCQNTQPTLPGTGPVRVEHDH